MLRNVRGVKDICKATAHRYAMLLQKAMEQASLYGYEFLETPILEYSGLFRRSMGELSDVVNKEMYTLEDRHGELLCLRPEMTASVVRAFLMHFRNDALPVKFFSYGPIFRYERPQKGRQRQFTQVNYECFGVDAAWLDVEVILLANALLTALNIQEKVKLRLNFLGSRDVVQRYCVKLKEFLECYRRDLSEISQKRLDQNVLRILDSKEPQDQSLLEHIPSITTCYEREDIERLGASLHLLEKAGITYQLDHTIVRGLDYYTHLIFEFVTDVLGAQGTVIGGGRYNNLVSDFTQNRCTVPAIGFAGGVERMLELMMPDASEPFFIYLISYGSHASVIEKAMHCATNLRRCGFRVVHENGFNVSKLLGKAAKGQAPIALIIGDEEVEQSNVKIKNLKTTQQFCVSDEEITNTLIFLREDFDQGGTTLIR